MNEVEVASVCGVVTAVNEILWHFDVCCDASEEQVRVHSGCYSAYSLQPLRAKVNDHLTLDKLHAHTTSPALLKQYFMDRDSTCHVSKHANSAKADETTGNHFPFLYDVIKANKLSVRQLQLLLAWFGSDATPLVNMQSARMVAANHSWRTFNMIQWYFSLYWGDRPHGLINTPCQLIELHKLGGREQITPYAMGFHQGQWLLGWLQVDAASGDLELADKQSKLCVKLLNKNKVHANTIRALINRYVIINLYVFANELIKTSGSASKRVPCVCVEVEGVRALALSPPLARVRANHSLVQFAELYPVPISDLQARKFVYAFQVLYLFDVNAAPVSKRPEVCMQVLWRVTSPATLPQWSLLYLVLTEHYLHALPLLQPGQVFDVYATKPIMPYQNAEFKRAIPAGKLMRIDTNSAILVENVNRAQHPPTPAEGVACKAPLCTQVYAFEEATQMLRKHRRGMRQVVSFEGVIVAKTLTKGDARSRTRLVAPPGVDCGQFGTPGDWTHMLKLHGEMSKDGRNAVTLYINNREQHTHTKGLVAGMRVRIHNVLAQNGSYYLSQFSSKYEVLGYAQPDILPRAVGVAHSMPAIGTHAVGHTIGHAYLLSDGYRLKRYTVIHSRPPIITMRSLKLCMSAKHVEEAELCKPVTVDWRELLQFTCTFYVQEGHGEAVVCCKDLGFFRAYLRLNEREFNLWCKVYLDGLATPHNYNISDPDQLLLDQIKDIKYETFYQSFLNIMHLYKAMPISNADITCKMQDNSIKNNGGKSFWFLTQLRQLNFPHIFRTTYEEPDE